MSFVFCTCSKPQGHMCLKFCYVMHYLSFYSQGSIIAGCFDINDHSIWVQVLGDHLEYDIAKCRMVSIYDTYSFWVTGEVFEFDMIFMYVGKSCISQE